MRLSRNPEAREKVRQTVGAPKFLNKKNSTYHFRSELQLDLWRRGMPVHNDIDNECCPDFSCCRGRQHMAIDKLREMFCRDPASRRAMMEMFIAELPDAMRMLYDLPNQAVFTMQPKPH